MKDLLELRLTNVNFMSHLHLQELMEALLLASNTQYLMKLALTDFNLCNDKIVDTLVDFVHERKHIQFFDITNARLKPRHIYEITLELADKYTQLRDINLSYNQLDFRKEGSDDYEYSASAITNLKTLLDRAKILNHVNFSGMNISKD